MHRIQQLHSHLTNSTTPNLTSANMTAQTLSQYLQTINIDPALITALTSITTASLHISARLRQSTTTAHSNSDNAFGDHQLNVDIDTDKLVFDTLKQNPHIATASSEETPKPITLHPSTPSAPAYSVTFDPLDGSSIIDANITVGSIYAVFKGSEITNITGKSHCVASAIAVYGPRTSIYIAIAPSHCTEFTYDSILNDWVVTHRDVQIDKTSKYFAPANLRAAAESQQYNQLVNYYISHKYTLRYTGGLVPDVAHMLTKKQGVFISPVTGQSKAKLRLLYEVIAIAYLVECAGGVAIDQNGKSIVELDVSSTDVRTGLICGSADEVQRYKQFMKL